MSDEYEQLAEFHDLFMAEPWQRLRPHLAAAFGHLSPDDVVIDVGAGTGVGTRALSRSTPAQIVAIEPSPTMRAVLLARVADDVQMTRQVSVVAGAAPGALDAIRCEVAGFVCAHMLGHLTPAQRSATWTRLAAALGRAGIGIVTNGPHAETEQAATDPFEEELTLGRHRYVARYEDSPDAACAQVTYEVCEGDRVLRSATTRTTWNPPSSGELRNELDSAGLHVSEELGGVVVVRHREAAA